MTDPTNGPTYGQCSLCERVVRKGTTRHHLIPRRCHTNKWFKKRFRRTEMQKTVPLCRDCHAAVHRFIPSEKELGRHYNTLDRLMGHTEIHRFVTWVRQRR